MSPRTHFVNADFDLSLRPRPRQLESPRLARQVRELSLQALLGASAGDSALVRAPVPAEFLAHLERSGLPVPAVLRHPEIDRGTRLRPFGWSAEAMELNGLHDRPAAHPALSTIRRVNSRSFALELEAGLEPPGTPGTVVESETTLESFLATARSASGWVLKSEHGHAGLANRRLRGSVLGPDDRRFLEDRLAEDDRLVVEPWLERERDWSAVFDVPFDPATLRIHETLCTRDGAPIGALFDPHGSDAAGRPEELPATAGRIAARLGKEGYFGPVCVDAFSWSDGEHSRLRPLVDLNCRRSMSDGAHRLWRTVAPDRTLYYRFFANRKLALPASLSQVLSALGSRRFDVAARRGILLASPIELGKLAVIFVAEQRPQVFALERWFRERFEG